MRRLSPSSQEGSPSLTLTGPDCGLAEITNGFSRGGPLNISPPDSPDLIRYLLHQPFIVEMGSPDLVTSPPASTKPGRQRSLNDSTANHASNWSCHDDNLLVTARARGQGWSQIQKEHFQTKTANACRKRHERLVAKRRSTEWNQEMLEKLSAEYIRRREQMWQPLANAVGEKWQNVEKACFEKGLKSLITQPRSQRKRDDDILHQQIQPSNISKHRSDEYPRRTSVMHLKDILAPD